MTAVDIFPSGTNSFGLFITFYINGTRDPSEVHHESFRDQSVVCGPLYILTHLDFVMIHLLALLAAYMFSEKTVAH